MIKYAGLPFNLSLEELIKYDSMRQCLHFLSSGIKKYGRHSKEGLTFKKLHLHSRSVDFMNVNGDILHFEASLPKHMKETWKKYNLPLNPNIEGFTVRD